MIFSSLIYRSSFYSLAFGSVFCVDCKCMSAVGRSIPVVSAELSCDVQMY